MGSPSRIHHPIRTFFLPPPDRKTDMHPAQIPDIMSLTEDQYTKILETMAAYAMAYKKKDIRWLKEIFSPAICGFGSGPDEEIRDFGEFLRQIRRDFSQATVLGTEFSETMINGDGRVAWVMTNTAISFRAAGGPEETMHGRSTMVMRNTGSRWLIEQIHFSMPYSGQIEGQSFPGA
jgi:ketosteroid isomerase-like protein